MECATLPGGNLRFRMRAAYQQQRWREGAVYVRRKERPHFYAYKRHTFAALTLFRA